MNRLKKITCVILACAFAFSMFTSVFASESIGVSVYADKAGAVDKITKKTSEEFEVYFGVDAVTAGDKALNTFKAVIWYDASVLTPVDGSAKVLVEDAGYVSANGAYSGTKTVEDKTYNGYEVAFTSYKPGITADALSFIPLVSVKFEGETEGTSEVFISAEDVMLLPIVSIDDLKSTIASSVVNEGVSVTVERKVNQNGSAVLPSVEKFTVTYNIDGKTTKVSVASGKSVKEPASPEKEGYKFEGWYKDSAFKNKYDFSSAVTSDITLYAKFTKIEEEKPPVEPTGPSGKLPFEDVKETDWYHDGIKFAWENGLVKGIGDTEFAPQSPLTRGTIVTLIHRMEKEPNSKNHNFGDVEDGAWYDEAIAWAAENEIVMGMGDGTFAPDSNVTREQIAVILYKYTKFKGGDISFEDTLSEFSDKENVSDWATEAMNWMVTKGLMKGMGDGTVSPKSFATRAEIVTILMRYMSL